MISTGWRLGPAIWVCGFLAACVAAQPDYAHPDLTTGQECTSFCLDVNGHAVYGTNLDYVKDGHQGLVFVNKRNLQKSFPQPDSSSNHIGWTAKYGSVSFNLIAGQSPWGGMNEAGLVVSLMRLDGSRCPKSDDRPWIQTHYWMQYVLDNFSTIEEVMASDSLVRTVSSGRVPHYMVCDKYGHCAAIEFLEGKMVTHSGSRLPIKVLANSRYERSLGEWRAYLEQREEAAAPVTGMSSRSRFIRTAEQVAAFEPIDSGTAVTSAFRILEIASGQNTGNHAPCWSIVFDAGAQRVYFRTIVSPEIRMIDFRKLDFSCETPAQMIDINADLSGDISDQLSDYSFDAHLDHAMRSGKVWGLKMTSEELRDLFKSYEHWRCR